MVHTGDTLDVAGVHLLGVQVLATVAVRGHSFVGTLLLAKLVDPLMGLRLSDSGERDGIDLVVRSETAYGLEDASGEPGTPPFLK